MPDIYGLRKAKSIGPSQEFPEVGDPRLALGMVPPETDSIPVADALKQNVLYYGLSNLRNKGLEYVDQNVQNPYYKIGLKTILNTPLLLRGQNPASGIVGNKLGPFEKSEKDIEEMLSQQVNPRKQIKLALDKADFQNDFLSKMKQILSGNK